MESFPRSLSRTKFCCWWWLFSFYEGLNYLEEAFETGHFMIKLSSKRFGPYIFHSQLSILSALRLFSTIYNIFDEIFWLFWIWPTSTKPGIDLTSCDAIKQYPRAEARFRASNKYYKQRSTSLEDQQLTKNHILRTLPHLCHSFCFRKIFSRWKKSRYWRWRGGEWWGD